MMELQEVITLALNSGVSVVVIGYFMFRDYKFMENLQVTLTTLVDTVTVLHDIVKVFPTETGRR